ncbi:MAG: hypothetical protein JWO02_4409, partial [Solirubrobacterales bacterium]|nr:hypothetical protein [Solirubrobacterales bacterium]
QKDGRRFMAYDGYIRPHLDRPNLAVMTKARVRRVLLENGVATGVEVEHGGRVATVRAGREVILSAGAIPSANLLMKSGIGPGEVLQAAGVPVQVERDGVGRNLQEHSGVSVSRYITGHWSLNTMKRPDKGLVGMYRLMVQRRGPLASPVVQAMGFAKTDPSLDRPDVQLHFLPFAYRMTPDAQSALTAEMPKRAAVAMQVTLCKPKTRGRIRITDSDPLSAPSIDHHLLGDPRDLDTLVEGCKFLTGLFAHERFAGSVAANCNPPVNPDTDAGWQEYVRASCNVAYHHVGTCRMGSASDPTSVVDPTLRVIGAERLRVIDAGIMPVVPSSNTYIPTIAVGEKGAAMIKAGV